jgi:hypothetical protein
MKKELYDIECFHNFFCVGIKNLDTKEIVFYEISEERNELKEIYNWFLDYEGFLISFNGIHYDNQVIKYLLLNYSKYQDLNWANVTSSLKYFSDKIIYGENYQDDEIKKVKYLKTKWIDIDLFAYWSKMLRISKKISLKSLGIQLGYPVVQELPYRHDSVLTIDQLPKLRYYNYTHDLGILELLTIKMQDDIKLRANIVKEYGIDCWSMDATKIASEALLLDYCRITHKKPFYVRNQRFEKGDMYLNDVLKGFDPEFKLPIFKELWNDILKSKDKFSRELLVNYNNTSIRLTYGVGGLHSINENEQYQGNDDYDVLTSDVASLYPNLIINYKCIRFPEVLNKYIQVKDERIIAKKAKEKQKDTFFKLILNSTSGLLDMEHGWLYFPEGAMRMRLIGQLILTKCIESCLINNWQVVSANTDGIEVIVPKHQIQQYKDILNMVCNKFQLDLEHEHYDKIIYKNVNNYICKTKSGDVKRKGFFKLDFNEKGQKEIPLGDSTDELVISKALHNYYINNISPGEFISNPEKYKLHIYDYCKSNKIGKDFAVFHSGKVQQQLNRYYFSKKGLYLFKQKKSKVYSETDRDRLTNELISKHNREDYPNWKPLSEDQLIKSIDLLIYGDATMMHVNVGEGVILFNNYEEKPFNEYNVNYSYYISKTQRIIDEINNFNQLKLF